MSYITSFLSSALSKLTQPSAPELTDGSTQGPIHQLRHQLLHYGLASIHRTLEDLDEKQAARWSANDTDKDHQSFSSNTKHMDMIAEVLFAKGQEPSLKSWNWAIEMLDKSWDSYKDTSPNVEEERKVEDECPVYAKSVRSDCELMRKIAKIDDGNPTVATEQLYSDLSNTDDEVWNRWEAAALEGASEEFKKGFEEGKADAGKVTGANTDASGVLPLLTAIIATMSHTSSKK